jgi:hypothetical protein
MTAHSYPTDKLKAQFGVYYLITTNSETYGPSGL